jgi:nicotinate (nicotinamide) nucleotide adenylyltransferase
MTGRVLVTMDYILNILLKIAAFLHIRWGNTFLESALIMYAKRLRSRPTVTKQRVAIFGASFNPTTLGHMDFIRILVKSSLDDFASVCVIPSAQSPLKLTKDYASMTDRLQMLELALQTHFTIEERTRIRVECLEVERQSPSWMVMTLTTLILQHQAQESYVLACGYDHLFQMQQWYRWQDLVHLCELYFFPREGVDIVTPVAVNACVALCKAGATVSVIFIDQADQTAFSALCHQQLSSQEAERLSLICNPHAQICASSATEIRAFYQHNGAKRPGGVSPEVHQYIVQHGCYRK